MYITLSFQVVILSKKLISNIQFLVQLACVQPLKLYHEQGNFGLGKAREGVLSFPQPLNPSTTQPTKIKVIHNTTTTLQQHHTNTTYNNLVIIFTHYTTTTPIHLERLKQHDRQHNTHNNTTTLQHIKELAIANTTTTLH